MIIVNTEKLQDVCKKILSAVDSSANQVVGETLEIKVKDSILYLNVTNKQYYTSVKIALDSVVDELFAVIDANLFLNLISKVTTKDVELSIDNKCLIVKANGKYKLPMIYEIDKLVELPEITISNPTTSFNINSEILQSIYTYNTKEIEKVVVNNPIRKLYYVDEQGCVTSAVGACVNSFQLEKPIKLLLDMKLVKLFKLFNEGNVVFTLGYEEVGSTIQTRVCFENDIIKVTAILPGDASMTNSYPAQGLRDRAFKTYPNSISLNKGELVSAVNRILLFAPVELNTRIGILTFDSNNFRLSDRKKENVETIALTTPIDIEQFEVMLDLNIFKTVLDSCQDEYVTISFGDDDKKTIVISRGTIKNVIPLMIKQPN